jgi:hypothetical protein
LPTITTPPVRITESMAGRGLPDDFNEDDFEDFNPLPYLGGYDIAETYGKPLPPSAAICHLVSFPVSLPPVASSPVGKVDSSSDSAPVKEKKEESESIPAPVLEPESEKKPVVTPVVEQPWYCFWFLRLIFYFFLFGGNV